MGVSAADQAVLDRIDEASLVDLTAALVRAEGQNPPGGEAATVKVLREAAVELGLDVVETAVEPDRNNLRITLQGGAGPGVLLLGHTDVVPVGEGWTTDPFGGAVLDGRMYGRGTSDMKGGLAASLAALAALRGVGLTGPVELAALVDEEETGKGIRAYVDSAQPSFLGCITAEPTDLQTIIGARGASAMCASKFTERPVTQAIPTDGANAIYGAVAVIAEIERMHAELAQRPHPLLGPATWSVGQIRRRRRRFHRARGMCGGRRPQAPAGRVARVRARRSSRARGGSAAGRPWFDGRRAMPMEMPAFQTPADSELAQDRRRRTGRRRADPAFRWPAGRAPATADSWPAISGSRWSCSDPGSATEPGPPRR